MHSGHAKQYLSHLLATVPSNREILARKIGKLVLESPHVDEIIDLLWASHSNELSRMLESTGGFSAWQEKQEG